MSPVRALWLLLLSGCVGILGGSSLDAGADAGPVHDDAGLDASVSDDAGTTDAGPIDAGFDSGFWLPPPMTLPQADGGTHPLDGGPAWLAGHQVNEWFPIPGTAGAGGAPVDDYSGMTLTSNGLIVIAAAGGHGGSSDNRVVSLDLLANDPAWVLRALPSSVTPGNVAYNPDTLPASRHTYQSTQWVPALNRVMLIGSRFGWPGAYSFTTVDGFNLDTNRWDPPGTWPDTIGGYGMVTDGDGNVWTDGLKKFTANTHTWSSPVQALNNGNVRWPWAWDPVRQQLFGLNFGDGQGYGDPVLLAERIPFSTNKAEQITMAPSTALDSWLADKPTYSGMDYDPTADRFLFYCGQDTGAGRVYVVTPSADGGTVWDMSMLALATGSAMPPAAPGSGVNNRFRYVPQLKGVVLLPTRDQPLWFLKLAD